MRIRSATLADWPEIARIFRAAGKAAWAHILPRTWLDQLYPPERWRQAISDPLQRVVVAAEDTDSRAPRLVAFAVLRRSGDPDVSSDVGEVDAFYSDHASWGMGYGRAMLGEAQRGLRDMGFAQATLWTAELNHRPRRIYEAAGWRADGILRERELDGCRFTEVRYVLFLQKVQ